MKIQLQELNISIGPRMVFRLVPENDTEEAVIRALWNGNRKIGNVTNYDLTTNELVFEFATDVPIPNPSIAG